jgi:cyclophilin family peptidyl-prolyl cis-trans isomerase
MSERVFLDIELKPTDEEIALAENYDRSIAFLREKGPLYSLPDNMADLDQTSKDLVRELYEADHEWSQKVYFHPFSEISHTVSSKQGPINFDKPQSLRCGRLVIELFTKDTPKTCENFKCLATGSKGIMKKAPNKPLHYLKSPVHRIVKNWIAQSGDITRFDGSGGESIYGGKFNDEKEGLKKNFERGTVAMANSGKNSNTSQFFFCLSSDKNKMKKLLDGKYVAFGTVVEEYVFLEDGEGKEERAQEGFVLDKINKYGTESGEPTRGLIIADCGLV